MLGAASGTGTGWNPAPTLFTPFQHPLLAARWHETGQDRPVVWPTTWQLVSPEVQKPTVTCQLHAHNPHSTSAASHCHSKPPLASQLSRGRLEGGRTGSDLKQGEGRGWTWIWGGGGQGSRCGGSRPPPQPRHSWQVICLCERESDSRVYRHTVGIATNAFMLA